MNLRKIIQKNKKGSTFEGWTEGIVFSMLFVIIFASIVIPGMNSMHNQSFEVENLPTGEIEGKFEAYQASQSEKLASGDASFTSAIGLTVSTSWDVLTSVLTMLMFFVTGGWVESIFSYLHAPSIVGIMIRGLWIVALGFIMLKVLFRDRI